MIMKREIVFRKIQKFVQKFEIQNDQERVHTRTKEEETMFVDLKYSRDRET